MVCDGGFFVEGDGDGVDGFDVEVVGGGVEEGELGGVVGFGFLEEGDEGVEVEGVFGGC